MVNESSRSPAAIARTQADEGASLTHPDLLDKDVRWRSAHLFTAEELNFDNPGSAVTWMENFISRRDQDQFRHALLNMKLEIELVVVSQRTSEKDRQLASEVHQWLTIWLQNPPIFADWFALRRKTAEFLQIFGS